MIDFLHISLKFSSCHLMMNKAVPFVTHCKVMGSPTSMKCKTEINTWKVSFKGNKYLFS